MSDAARAKAETIMLKNAAHLLRGRGIPCFDAHDLVVIVAKGLDAFAAEQTAALRALVEKVAKSDGSDGGGCAGQCDFYDEARALLADAGQAGEEWRALMEFAESYGRWQRSMPSTPAEAQADLDTRAAFRRYEAAVERARQR